MRCVNDSKTWSWLLCALLGTVSACAVDPDGSEPKLAERVSSLSAEVLDAPPNPDLSIPFSTGLAPAAAATVRPVAALDAPVVVARVAFKASDSLEFDMDTGIGVIPADGSCSPENDSWRGGPMFGNSDVRTPAGYKFCLYRRVSNVVGSNALPPYCPRGTCANRSKVLAPASGWLEPAPHALLRQGSPEAARRVANALRAQLRSELRSLAQFPSGTQPPVLTTSFSASNAIAVTGNALPAPVVVHVIDDESDHGNAVASLISALACPPAASVLMPGCPIEIRRHNVFEVEPGSSIERGSAARLALLIVAIADAADGTPSVINLSLGFHPEAAWGQAPSAQATGGVLQIGHMALQAAINYARCRGIVVISAAGNRDGGGGDGDQAYDGFMLPAAWHTKDGWTCGTTTPTPVSEPLLYAASAVRGDGRPVASARPRGEGLLVAPGFMNTVEPSTGLGRWYWEGSSFATAAISAAAARVRAYMPFEANALAAMRTIWSSGAPMPDGRSSSGLGYASAQVRRVRICHGVRAALERACTQPGYAFACAMQSALACTEPASNTWPHALSDDRSLLNDESSGALATLWQPESQGALPSSAACGGSGIRVFGTPAVWAGEGGSLSAEGSGVWNPPNPRNAYSCPFETLGNGQRDSVEIGHQPGSTGCHGCVVYRTASNTLVFTGAFEVGWAEISSSPSLRTRGVANTSMALVGSSSASERSLFAATTDEALYELGEALTLGESITFELTDAAPESLDDVELVLEYVVEHDDQSYSIAQTVPLIDLL